MLFHLLSDSCQLKRNTEYLFYEVYGALNILLIFPVCLAHSNM